VDFKLVERDLILRIAKLFGALLKWLKMLRANSLQAKQQVNDGPPLRVVSVAVVVSSLQAKHSNALHSTSSASSEQSLDILLE
jgi:hypothetical protein